MAARGTKASGRCSARRVAQNFGPAFEIEDRLDPKLPHSPCCLSRAFQGGMAGDNREASRLSRGGIMADPARLAELDQHIAAVRENIRILTEQAAAYSGAADEERNADRIAEQDALLTRLLNERDTLTRNG